ncbi:SRPBCC family protein [Yinghuangia seranimata]|uniref:SRPBCC family protein n=1 Tax=Yinghuangia seranimata TaxID=408067 RepID=UPI00248A96BE|nr:SRPBCC family protein [Yinghuangia seranimata]MDI2132305.1 SRPBCC family protein [Yinghuangia seranimata]
MTIAVGPKPAYDVVVDVGSIGSRSPETVGVTLRDSRALAVGSRFTGHNRNGRFRWSTRCTVVAADAGREFAFDVASAGFPISSWRYEFAPTEDGTGTVVTETWYDRRGMLMKALSTVVTGVRDRPPHNRRTMQATLAALKTQLEERPHEQPEGDAP